MLKKDKAVVVEGGFSEQSTNPGWSVLLLVVECYQKAIQDAGLIACDLDGIFEFNAGDKGE